MECYVHIGTVKTGTSSIQQFLATNKEELLKLGFYTDFNNFFNNWPLSLMCLSEYREDIILNALLKLAHVKNQKELDTFSKEYFHILKNLVQNHLGKKFIFSSENIHLELKSKFEIEKLKDILHSLGFQKINIIIYLREPYSLACSLFSEMVKHGHDRLQPPHPKDSFFNHVCNHKKTLIAWEEVFGKENLTVRVFDKKYFVKNSLIQDFLYAVNCHIPVENFIDSADLINEGLSNTSVLAQALGNHFDKKIRIRPAATSLSGFKQFKYEMSPSLKKEYKKEFEESNKWVIKNYFSGLPNLFKESYLSKVEEKDTLMISENDLYSIASGLIDSVENVVMYPKFSKILDFILKLGDILENNKKYIFYGYSNLARLIEKLYSGIYDIYFVDSDLLKVDNQNVFDLETVKSISFSKLFICVPHKEDEIKRFLIEMHNVDKSKIFSLY